MKKKFNYGVYKLKENKYNVSFWNVLTKDKEFIGNFNNEEEANKSYSLYEFNFYTNNRFLLPRFVSVDSANKTFKYCVRFEGKIIISRNFKTVQLCLNHRDLLLKTVIG